MILGGNKYGSEQQLWEAFLSGDNNAFANIFDIYSDSLYSYGKKISPDSELVKDTIQDLFVKLYNNRESLNSTESVKGYLFTALKRTLYNRLSKSSFLSIDSQDELRFEIELISDTSNEVNDIEYDDEVKRRLSDALDKLTPRQREAIYLYYIQEIPLSEIPDILGMNYQSTRNLIHRALLNLRQHFDATVSYAYMSLLLVQYLSK
ncbi:MAG: RNA polymerase sigma factor [Bacteroidales bacterium]